MNRSFALAVAALLPFGIQATPVMWTISEYNNSGQEIFGSFIYDQDTELVSAINVHTLDLDGIPDSESNVFDIGDTDGVFATGGAYYSSVVESYIDGGQLFEMTLLGVPNGSPGLIAYLHLTFDPIGNENGCDSDELCSPPLGYSIIGSTYIHEWACLASNPMASSQEGCGLGELPIAARDTSEHLMTPTFVPVPAAAWLFGGALGVMGWMRRSLRGDEWMGEIQDPAEGARGLDNGTGWLPGPGPAETCFRQGL